MRLPILVLAFAICSSLVFAQSEDESKKSVMMNIVEPEFEGTNENLRIKDFIEENLRTPLDAQKWRIEGVVVIRFNVLPTRDLSEFQVIQSVCSSFDEAVMDVLEASNGMWKPGTINDLPVPMEKEVTVIYTTEGTQMYTTAQLNKNKADKLLKEGKYSRAIKRYTKTIESYPIDDLTIYRRGLAKYYSGNLEGAIHDFERVADLESHLADPMLTRLGEVADFAKNELQLSSLIY